MKGLGMKGCCMLKWVLCIDTPWPPEFRVDEYQVLLQLNFPYFSSRKQEKYSKVWFIVIIRNYSKAYQSDLTELCNVIYLIKS